jgi:hypothetical protein
MRGKKTTYIIINIAVILSVALLFAYEYIDVKEIFHKSNALSLIILIVTVLLVHTVKSARLFLALYGSDITFTTYLKVYCKVTPVSVVIPFKLGEFFRMYCYGKELGNVLRGVVIILLDRFMDTAALVTTIILVWVLIGGDLPLLVYILFLFLIAVLLIFLLFNGVRVFWNKYLLKAAASENKLAALKFLSALNVVYQEIKNVVKGRGIIMYAMSIVAWCIEIGSIAILNGLLGERELVRQISSYLTSAMGGNTSIELKQFVFVSVVMLIACYIMIKVVEMVLRKKVRR